MSLARFEPVVERHQHVPTLHHAADTDIRSVLKLLPIGLLESEHRRLTEFISLGSERLRARWLLVDSAPADASIVNADEVPTIPVGLEPDAPLQLWLRRSAPAGISVDPLALAIPLQFEPLIAALQRAEALLRHQRSDRDQSPAATPTTSTPLRVPDVRDTPARGLSLRLLVGHGFQLSRCPPVELLQRHPDGARIAPFLSSRLLELTDVSRVSGIPLGRCSTFLQLLLEARLLRVEPLARLPIARRTVPALDSVLAEPERRGKEGLLARFRQRLGLVR